MYQHTNAQKHIRSSTVGTQSSASYYILFLFNISLFISQSSFLLWASRTLLIMGRTHCTAMAMSHSRTSIWGWHSSACGTFCPTFAHCQDITWSLMKTSKHTHRRQAICLLKWMSVWAPQEYENYSINQSNPSSNFRKLVDLMISRFLFTFFQCLVTSLVWNLAGLKALGTVLCYLLRNWLN